MGSMPKLKIKKELNYRQGSTNESLNCRYCIHFVPVLQSRQPGKMKHRGYLPHYEGRCDLMGLDEGIRYRIWSDYRCDAQKFDELKCDWITQEKARVL